jgi:hypothetical protein
MADRHRLRVTTDYIYEGPKLSPTAQLNVAKELSSLGHTVAFGDIKNVEVVFTPKDERVVYAHHHSASGGNYCREDRGCLEQAQDGLDQEDL